MTRTLALIVLLCGAVLTHAQPVTPETEAFANFTREWRDDPVWKDTAEVAVYDVTRVIGGKTREYRATVITHKELADPVTKTRSATNEGREVFKQITREDIPTDSGVEHVSTMVYVGVSDLKSLRIDVAWMNSVGTTFKWYANHKGTLDWHQFSYHPGEGHKAGTYSPPQSFVFHDSLGVVLRGYPFEKSSHFEVQVLPDQTTNKLTPEKPRRGYLRLLRRETLDLPIGKVEAFRLQAYFDENEDGSVDLGAAAMMNYWLAADAKPPMLHAMVQYQDPDGTMFKLRSLERKPLAEVRR